jgi:hypothetical protein
MKTLFLISSAIHTVHGVYSAEERLNQTIKTFESIKSKDPDARILLVESSSKESITDAESDLMKPYVEGILNFHPDQQVQDITKMSEKNWDVAKNLTELIVFGKALDFIIRQQPALLEGIDRVFKLSGRYILNENFNMAIHLDPKMQESYIFAVRRASQFPPQVTGGLTEQVMSRCWSWPTVKTAMIFFRYNVMIEHFIGMLSQQKYVDIEHLLLKYFSGPYTVEIPIIGVEGNLGPTGNLVKD